MSHTWVNTILTLVLGSAVRRVDLMRQGDGILVRAVVHLRLVREEDVRRLTRSENGNET